MALYSNERTSGGMTDIRHYSCNRDVRGEA